MWSACPAPRRREEASPVISNNTSSNISFNASSIVADRSIVASACSLGFSLSFDFDATRVSGVATEVSLRPLGGLPVLERVERPTEALEAGVAKAQVKTYAFAATGAGTAKKQTQHHMTWAFRGLEPWSDPA
ncbi:hypothetical protein [Streptomyces clavuligerus]|uniref:Uncharacterized protein n=1 Tax=Streptomyces clavuligerus TaxID=1901 RepID=E2Q4W8_STRCL|nr:Hypothetical protein SCLAV_4053 [Streptomyces clavuligerus]